VAVHLALDHVAGVGARNVGAEYRGHVVRLSESLDECGQPAVVRRCRVLGEEGHVLAARHLDHAVAGAAVGELARRDLMNHRAVLASDVLGAVRGARVDDQDLHLPVDPLAAHGRQHLVQVARPVEHGNGDGDGARH
jgi:hypothetical protein